MSEEKQQISFSEKWHAEKLLKRAKKKATANKRIFSW
jgi:hypothetical protein